MYRRTILLLTLVLFPLNQAFSQTVWQKYQNNPVLIPNEAWESAFGVIGPRVLKINNAYKMWYTGLGTHRQIGLATSTDGIHWTKSTSNPVLSNGQPGDFDADHVDYATVLFHDNQFWMWYVGYKAGVRQIGLATSPDGEKWTKHPGNPVLTVGASSTWDAQSVLQPVVIFDGKLFKMWYNGSGRYIQAGGYAESTDGIQWKKHQNNPVFTPLSNSWESNAIGINAVSIANGVYHMWYGGNDGIATRFGYAISKDGVQWERYGGNPVLAPSITDAWDRATLGGFDVLREGNTYKMWYSGRNSEVWHIGYATSQITPPPSSKRLVFLPRVYGLPGDTIAVALFADSINGISGGDVIVKFDPEVLNASKVQPTEFTRNFLIVANLDTPGVARISLASVRGAVGGPGSLFNIKMVVKSKGPIPPIPRPQPLQLSYVALYTEGGTLIPLTKRDGEFVLGRTRGDVNRDGRVNSADAILALRIAAGLLQPTPTQLADADVDGNGRVESIDASCMLLRAVGLECAPGGASSVAANLRIAPFSITAGNEIATTVSVSGIDHLLSGDVSLRFDANAIEVMDIQPSAELSKGVLQTNLNHAGQVQFSFATANGVQAQAIAVIRLRAKTPITEKSLRSNFAVFFDTQSRRWNGILTAVEETVSSDLPNEFNLKQNYPNPFHLKSKTAGSTNTQIRYALPERAHVKLIVYDLYGRQVRLLEDTAKEAGSHLHNWNGLDDSGVPVASGVYLYRLQIGQTALTKKMTIVE